MPSDVPAATEDDGDALVDGAGPELLADGQEEVFSYTAVERGLVKDPLAMDPALWAEAPPVGAGKPVPCATKGEDSSSK